MTDWREQELEVIQRARQREALRQLDNGTLQVPLACQFCHGGVVDAGKDGLECLQCGRLTGLATAHQIRRQKMAAIIRRGVDIDVRAGSPHTQGGAPSATGEAGNDRSAHR